MCILCATRIRTVRKSIFARSVRSQNVSKQMQPEQFRGTFCRISTVTWYVRFSFFFESEKRFESSTEGLRESLSLLSLLYCHKLAQTTDFNLQLRPTLLSFYIISYKRWYWFFFTLECIDRVILTWFRLRYVPL